MNYRASSYGSSWFINKIGVQYIAIIGSNQNDVPHDGMS